MTADFIKGSVVAIIIVLIWIPEYVGVKAARIVNGYQAYMERGD